MEIALCQGWNRSGELVERGERKLAVGEVLIANYRVMVLNPETQEPVYTDSHDTGQHICQISNEEPTAITSCTIDNSADDDTDMAKFKILYNDTVTIQVKADLLLIDEPVKDIIPRDSMREDMYSLYKADKFTDTIIKCEEALFKVHKAVLASQSPVFGAMFEADMKESRSGIVEVSGITSAALSDLITYLYTGTAPNLKTLANELLDVADKYQLYRLVMMCASELQNRMTETSIVRTLIQADLHGRSGLKKACFEFFRLNSRSVKISEWEDLKCHYPSLYMEALEYCVERSR